jgi:hypothetical protein
MIYTAPYVMLLMRAASITRARGRGLGPGETFLSPVKWHRANECDLGPKKVEIPRARPSSTCQVMEAPRQKHYAQGRINHRCFGDLM